MSVWNETYCPSSLQDITGHVDIINVFKHYVETKKIPNIILYGGSGCGKTSTILSMARDLYGDDYDKDVYELNASDERGIDVVREKIHTIAKKKVSSVVGFKMIVLDEADFLTKGAQAALRKIMEMYTDKTVFCLMCNYIYNIIPPIQSRCASFYFKPLSTSQISTHLSYIAGKENIKIPENTLDIIIDQAHGDLRKAIILLQHSTFNNHEPINDNIIKLYNCIMTSESLKTIHVMVDEMYTSGHKLLYITRKIFHMVMMDDEMYDGLKKEYIQHITSCDKFILLGCNEYLQLLKMTSKLYHTRTGSNIL